MRYIQDGRIYLAGSEGEVPAVVNLDRDFESYLERAFSAIWRGRSYPVFSRHTRPMAISILKASCSLSESFFAAFFTSPSIVSVSLTGTVFRSFSSFFIKNKLHTKFILDNP